MTITTKFAELDARTATILEALGAEADASDRTGTSRERALAVWEYVQTALVHAEQIMMEPFGDGDRPNHSSAVAAALAALRQASTPATLLYRAAVAPVISEDEFGWAAQRTMRYLNEAADALVSVRY